MNSRAPDAGNPAVFLRPVAFRLRLATDLALADGKTIYSLMNTVHQLESRSIGENLIFNFEKPDYAPDFRKFSQAAIISRSASRSRPRVVR